MSLFLLLYVLIYGGMNAYAVMRVQWCLEPGTRAMLMLGAWAALMVAAPIMVRLTEGWGMEGTARVLAYVGFTWFGLVFMFAAYSLAFDLYGIVSRLTGLPALSRRLSLFIPLVIALLAFVYGLYEASSLRVERVEIRSPHIKPERLRIMQISDVHLGLLVTEHHLRDIIDTVRAQGPDVLVATGDMVDAATLDARDIAMLLSELNPPLGKYAVMGNHEFYVGMQYSESFLRSTGFRVLRDELVMFDQAGLAIAGADYSSERRGINSHRKDGEVLELMPHEMFRLYLKHVPYVTDAERGGFDLQLSGHTHKGQIFPFGLIVRIPFPYLAGLYGLGDGSSLYVSRGTGTWGPPIRVLSPPEITVIDIIRQ